MIIFYSSNPPYRPLGMSLLNDILNVTPQNDASKTVTSSRESRRW
jgi:hypothetical protein